MEVVASTSLALSNMKETEVKTVKAWFTHQAGLKFSTVGFPKFEIFYHTFALILVHFHSHLLILLEVECSIDFIYFNRFFSHIIILFAQLVSLYHCFAACF